jgi:DNA repair photolyase
MVELKGSNLIGNYSAQDYVIDELLKVEELSFKEVRKYAESDLKLSKMSLESFKKSFEELRKKQEWSSIEDEVYLMGSFLETNDSK